MFQSLRVSRHVRTLTGGWQLADVHLAFSSRESHVKSEQMQGTCKSRCWRLCSPFSFGITIALVVLGGAASARLPIPTPRMEQIFF